MLSRVTRGSRGLVRAYSSLPAFADEVGAAALPNERPPGTGAIATLSLLLLMFQLPTYRACRGCKWLSAPMTGF